MDGKKLVASAAAAMMILGGASATFATIGDPSEQATGAGIEKAESAALEYTKGGSVSGTEIGDEEGYYEIEVTREDGSQVDVHLDRDLKVLGTLADHESPDDKDGPNDD